MLSYIFVSKSVCVHGTVDECVCVNVYLRLYVLACVSEYVCVIHVRACVRTVVNFHADI